jgi:hypothetical protein
MSNAETTAPDRRQNNAQASRDAPTRAGNDAMRPNLPPLAAVTSISALFDKTNQIPADASPRFMRSPAQTPALKSP